MRQVFGEHYVAKSLRDDYELGITYTETIDGVRQEIDRSNERAVSQGYPAHQFIICKVQTLKLREDNGQFVMSTVVTVAVEKYPAELGGE